MSPAKSNSVPPVAPLNAATAQPSWSSSAQEASHAAGAGGRAGARGGGAVGVPAEHGRGNDPPASVAHDPLDGRAHLAARPLSEILAAAQRGLTGAFHLVLHACAVACIPCRQAKYTPFIR